MDTDLVTRLQQATSVAALAKSVSWVTRPTKAQMPGVTLQKLSPGRAYSFKAPVGTSGTYVRFDFWGQNVRDVKPLFEAVRAVMEVPADVGATSFGMSFVEAERDMPAEEVPELGTVYRLTADFLVWWQPL